MAAIAKAQAGPRSQLGSSTSNTERKTARWAGLSTSHATTRSTVGSPNYALLHTGGNHYVALIRTG